MAYCEVGDLLKGDIPYPDRYGDGTDMINLAADDIDASLGHIYVTPIVIPATPASNRPATLLLKKINQLLASGRLITDMAASAEDRDLHAYGASLIREAQAIIAQIQRGEIVLTGATKLPGQEEAPTGPTVLQEDEESLVEAFYQQYSRGECRLLDPPAPYKDRTSL